MRVNNFVQYFTYPELTNVLSGNGISVPSGVANGTVLLCTEDEDGVLYNFLLYFGAYSTDANGSAIWNSVDKVWEYV